MPSWPFWPRARGSDGTLVASATVADRETAVAPPGLPEIRPPEASPPGEPDGPARWYQRRGAVLPALALNGPAGPAIAVAAAAQPSLLVPPADGGFRRPFVGPIPRLAGGRARG